MGAKGALGDPWRKACIGMTPWLASVAPLTRDGASPSQPADRTWTGLGPHQHDGSQMRSRSSDLAGRNFPRSCLSLDRDPAACCRGSILGIAECAPWGGIRHTYTLEYVVLRQNAETERPLFSTPRRPAGMRVRKYFLATVLPRRKAVCMYNCIRTVHLLARFPVCKLAPALPAGP